MSFPLSLEPFEEYMLVDDRPTHPMTFFLRLVFAGDCDTHALDVAFRRSLTRHPLLSAHVQTSAGNRFEWVHSRKHAPTIHWQNGLRRGQGGATYIDLMNHPGLHIRARREDDRTELVLQFHHACCDAVGALRFVEDLLVAYAAGSEQSAELIPFRPLDERRLHQRGKFGLTRWRLLRRAHLQAIGLRGAWHFLVHKPVPMKPVAAESVTVDLPKSFPANSTHEFSASQTSALVAAARSSGTTVNNLLARDLFLAIDDFRNQHGIGHQHEWLRLSIPINLRSSDDEQLSATNVMSYIFLDRKAKYLADRNALLKGIHRKMRLVMKLRLGLTFPLSLSFSRAIPGSLRRWRRMSQTHSCRGTAVLSNLVKPLPLVPLPRREGRIVAGGLILDRIELLPPVRPYTAVAFGVLTYAERMNVALHYDSRAITKENAQCLLAGYVKRLHETMNV